MKCFECGCAITATTKVKRYERTNRSASYTYYHCTKRRGKCSQQPLTEFELEDMTKEYLSAISIDRDVWDLGISLLKEKNKHELEATIDIKTKLELELHSLDKKLSRLLDLRLNEEIGTEEYASRNRKKVLLDRQLSLKEKMEDKQQSTKGW